MRFTLAWTEILSQNSLLKWLLFLMALLSMFLGTGLVFVSSREPLIIERACFSNVLRTNDSAQTTSEVKSFLIGAIGQRFDSQNLETSFLSAEEKQRAQKDRDELLNKKIKQKIIINFIEVSENKIVIDSDRIVSVDSVRTAFKFPLEVKIATVSRTDTNPYGLLLTSALTVQD